MDVRHLTFRLLQVFMHVARTGNISASARALHLTQPTISLQLKKLSDTIGERLFTSAAGALELTEAGRELYLAAGDVLGRFEDFSLYLERSRGGTEGHISIAIVTTAKYVLPRILGPFYRHAPRIGVTLSIGNRARILERFARQEDDLYVFSHPPVGASVQASRIVKNPLQIIAPLDHWAVGQASLAFGDISAERFLMREPGSATRMMFEAWLTGHGLELADTMQIESNEAIRLSVASGLGLSVISAHTLQEGRDEVAVLDVDGFPLESHWYLVSRRDRRLSHAAMALVRYIAGNLGHCIDPALVAADIGELTGHYG